MIGVDQCSAPVASVFGDDVVRCPGRGLLEYRCPYCAQVFWACSPAHLTGAEMTAEGHVLRYHFRDLPRARMVALARDADRMADLRGMERRLPGKFSDLIRFLEGLR